MALLACMHGIIESQKMGKRIQVAIMAPTEILARQHFQSMQDMFTKYQVSSMLLVGSVSAKVKKSVKADLKQGNIDVIIGTHAIIQEDIFFKNL